MITVRNELSIRKEEAEVLFELINNLIAEPISINKSSILKSSLVLLLYNIVESTLFASFERIHEEFSNYTYNHLSNNIKNLYVDYYFKKHGDKMYKEHLDATLSCSIKMPCYSDYTNKINLFGGNIDARKINDLFKIYGIACIKSKHKDQLLIIKNKRNKIAHGEESFKEACRLFTLKEMETLKNSTFITMDELIDNFENYLTKKLYLNA